MTVHREDSTYARAEALEGILAAAWVEGWKACMDAQDYIQGVEATVNPYDGTIWPEYKRPAEAAP